MSTRETILNQALRLFATHGYAGGSMRKLAKACGIRESSIYNHFENKRALFAAVLEQAGPAVVPPLVQSPLQSRPLPPFEAAMARLGADLIETWSDPLHQQLYLLSLREPDAARDATGQTRAAAVSDAVAALAGLLQTYAKKGEISLPSEAPYLAWQFLAALANLRVTYFAPGATRTENEQGAAFSGQHIDHFIRQLKSGVPSHAK